jgi:2-polyprenyl-3-methyl-5-hydroxy-6-metoxy-1,4-benzoquinol methylase
MKNLEKFYKSSRNSQTLGYGYEKIYLKWLGCNKIILDIGCNDGSAGSVLIKQGNTVYGIDIVKENVENALKKGVKAIRMDINSDISLPYEDNFFDVIIAGDIIEHIFDTDAFMRKFQTKLKNNGTLILATPNLASLGRRLLLLLGRNPYVEYSLEDKISGAEPVGHIRYFVKDDLIRFLNKHGFRVDAIVSDRLNAGLFSSKILGWLFPSLGWRFIVKATKVNHGII